jgi:predicted DNA-binding transcriptional regulator YafY
MDIAVARRRIPRAVGMLTEVAEGVRLRMRAERLDGAAALLAGLGCALTVEEPDELRDELRTLASRLLASSAR